MPSPLLAALAAAAQGLREVLSDAGAADDPGARRLMALAPAGVAPPDFACAVARCLSYALLVAHGLTHQGRLAPGRDGAAALLGALPSTSPWLAALWREAAALLEGPARHTSATRTANALQQIHALLAAAPLEVVSAADPAASDPLLHLYPHFLAAYAPAQRQQRGVYNTPDAVVDFILAAVDAELQEHLGDPLGLASTRTAPAADAAHDAPAVRVLDFATGTGTFLVRLLRFVHAKWLAAQDEMAPAARRAAWRDYARALCQERLAGRELDLAAWAVCHLHLGLVLRETGWNSDDLPQVALRWGDALACGLSMGAAAAASPLAPTVVIGNPPYGPARDHGRWIQTLMQAYRHGMAEKKSDVGREEWKFVRAAQAALAEAPVAVLGVVVNRALLDAVTLRQMRRSLGETFARRWLIDLGGDVKGERGQGRDENVFPIAQGVCVAVLSRAAGASQSHAYRAVAGRRVEKLQAVATAEVGAWRRDSAHFAPRAPAFHWHRPGATRAGETGWIGVDQAVSRYSSGIETQRDALCVAFTAEEMLARVRLLAELDEAQARAHFALGPDGRDWKLARAQADLRHHGVAPERVVPILYRPFDLRWTYYSGRSHGFLAYPKHAVSGPMLAGPNLGLMVNRQVVSPVVSHFGVSRWPICKGTFYLGNRGQDYLLPLYLPPPEPEAAPLLNLDPAYLDGLLSAGGWTWRAGGRGDLATHLGPEDILAFWVGLMHSPAYGAHFGDALRGGFPPVPRRPRREHLVPLAKLGHAITALFVDFSEQSVDLSSDFHGPEACAAPWTWRERPRHDPRRGVVDLGNGLSLPGVDAALWRWEVGGYRPLERWLLARWRVRRPLDAAARRTCAQILAALRRLRACAEALAALEMLLE